MNKVKNLRKLTIELMQSGNAKEVKCTLEKIVCLCVEARNAHESLVCLMVTDEREKQDTWFAAKMLVENDYIVNVQNWLTNNGTDENEVHPDDSISNVASRHSHRKSTCSGKSSYKSGKSIVSARIKMEAEKAALLARATALKEKHALEAQEEELRRKKEQIEMDAKIAASTAKLAVFQAASEYSRGSQAPSDGMNSYLQKTEEQKRLTPTANSFKPSAWSAIPQSNFVAPHKDSRTMDGHLEDKRFQKHGTAQYGDMQQPIFSTAINSAQPALVEQQHLYAISAQGDLRTIMHRQNEITAALCQQQRLMSLPSRDIPVFDGDPLQYKTFIRAFEHSVESKANNADCLYFFGAIYKRSA